VGCVVSASLVASQAAELASTLILLYVNKITPYGHLDALARRVAVKVFSWPDIKGQVEIHKRHECSIANLKLILHIRAILGYNTTPSALLAHF